MTFIMLVNECSAIRVTIILSSCTESLYTDNLGQSVREGMREITGACEGEYPIFAFVCYIFQYLQSKQYSPHIKHSSVVLVLKNNLFCAFVNILVVLNGSINYC